MKQLVLALLAIPALISAAHPASTKRGLKRKISEVQPYNAHEHALAKQQADVVQATQAITEIMPMDVARIIAQYAIAYGVVFDLTPYICTREELDLSKHCITAIVVGPRKFPDVLRILNLSDNLLTKVPSTELMSISSLASIDLDDNQFDEGAEEERGILYRYFRPTMFVRGPRGFSFN